MRLNIECVRDVMLFIEEDIQHLDEYSDITEMSETLPYDTETIIYTCEKLIEAGFLNGHVEYADLREMSACNISSITFQGHEYLDKIRCKTVFDKIHRLVSENGGRVSLSLFGSLCEKAFELLLNKYLA